MPPLPRSLPGAGPVVEPRLNGRPPRLPPGVRLYAIGDLHGRLDLLERLEAAVLAEQAAASPGLRSRLVYLGDLVDRGPDSRGVLERLMGPLPLGLSRTVLLGNHDRWLRDFLDTGDADPDWLENGGEVTLRSYGVALDRRLAPETRVERAHAEARRAVPPAHRQFLAGLPTAMDLGDYYFCHAGVRPGVALTLQAEDDLVWIREPFLEHPGELGAIVVHGHTPALEPQQRRHRIGVDTGAVWTGRLTAVVLEGTGRRFLTVSL